MSKLCAPPFGHADLRWQSVVKKYRLDEDIKAPPRQSLVQKPPPTLDDKHEQRDQDRKRRKLFSLLGRYWPAIFDCPVPYPIPPGTRAEIMDFYGRGGEFSKAEVLEVLAEWDERCEAFRGK